MTEREPSPSQDSTATSAGAAPSAHGTHAHDDPRAHERHYVRVWAALCVLLVVSVVGPMLEIPIVTLLTAFGIAVVKAYLVVRFFMHLPLEPKYVAYLG
ncbi:MAG: cytochrome C oxidase subunit IV family protein, partial [Geminicoccaceae bacterium]|nr:cytochrome C oxidase subunit IV family protein [Geminicoccaceae bacterium]